MHELGVLRETIKIVDRIAVQHRISRIRHITLEVGEESGYVPFYLEKLFPVATDPFPAIREAQLRLQMAPGHSLIIKDIGY